MKTFPFLAEQPADERQVDDQQDRHGDEEAGVADLMAKQRHGAECAQRTARCRQDEQ